MGDFFGFGDPTARRLLANRGAIGHCEAFGDHVRLDEARRHRAHEDIVRR